MKALPHGPNVGVTSQRMTAGPEQSELGKWAAPACPDDTMMGDSCETTFLPSYKPVSKGEEEGKKLEENIFPQIYNVTEL